MNALQNIQREARIIVEQLTEREINRLKNNYNLFEVWMVGEGNPIINQGKTDLYESIQKYIYMTQYKKWNPELSKYELPNEYPQEYRKRREMFYNKECSNMVNELRLITNNWENKYRETFIQTNMVKLNRSLAKHIDDNMSASNIRVNIGGDGAEVLANVDDKIFRTFGTLCGGWVQCLHYRYRSSLK
jgi:hypothetical protein